MQASRSVADRLKARVPWRAKLAAKLLLSRMRLPYRLWQRLALFQHGYMADPAYAYGVFTAHFERSAFPGKGGGFTCLELGPGDSLFSALIAKAFGAACCHLVDAGNFCRRETEAYLAMASFLARVGHPLPAGTRTGDLATLLADCGACYRTEGLASLQAIPSASVDWIWSQAVLEHIPREEFPATMAQLRRILKPDGVCSHRVDLQDHLGGALNNLRFSTATWESDWMRSAGFYTNRIRFAEMARLFEAAGFVAEYPSVSRWDALPTPRRCMDAEFARLDEHDLRVSGFDVLLFPRVGAEVTRG